MISLESFAILVLYEGTTKRGSTMSDERDKRFEDKRFEELRSTMSAEAAEMEAENLIDLAVKYITQTTKLVNSYYSNFYHFR